MMEPRDGDTADDAFNGNPLGFWGYHLYANSVVEVMAYDFGDDEFDALPNTALSSSSSSYTLYGEELYYWETQNTLPQRYWEAGAAGHRARVKARGGQEFITFDKDADPYGCSQNYSDLETFAEECSSASSPSAWLRTSDFVPDVTQAAVGCSYATEDACSPCVQNSLTELTRPEIDISSAEAGYRVQTGDAPCCEVSPHMQGIVRFADVDLADVRLGRVALTHNLWAGGLTYAEQWVTTLTTPPDAIYSSSVDAQELYELDIRAERDHPGGAQAHGDVMAVAMEQGPATHASVDFFRFPSDSSGQFVNRVVLDGSRGEPRQSSQNAASSAGFLKLEDGHYLVAVAGRKHGVQGIWFYRSDRTVIEAETTWEFIGFWGLDLDTKTPIDGWPGPPCARRKKGAVRDGCYGGATALTLLADCDGTVRMVVMNGTDDSGIFATEYQWNQVYRITQNASGQVVPVWEYSQWDGTGVSQINNPAFRWAGGLYVTEAGLPTVFNTERQTRRNSKNHVNGALYFRPPSTLARTETRQTASPPMRDAPVDPDDSPPSMSGESGPAAAAAVEEGAR